MQRGEGDYSPYFSNQRNRPTKVSTRVVVSMNLTIVISWTAQGGKLSVVPDHLGLLHEESEEDSRDGTR